MQATASQGLSEGVRVPPCLSEPASAGWGWECVTLLCTQDGIPAGTSPCPADTPRTRTGPLGTALPLNPSSEGAESLNCHFFSGMGPEDTKNKPAD